MSVPNTSLGVALLTNACVKQLPAAELCVFEQTFFELLGDDKADAYHKIILALAQTTMVSLEVMNQLCMKSQSLLSNQKLQLHNGNALDLFSRLNCGILDNIGSYLVIKDVKNMAEINRHTFMATQRKGFVLTRRIEDECKVVISDRINRQMGKWFYSMPLEVITKQEKLQPNWGIKRIVQTSWFNQLFNRVERLTITPFFLNNLPIDSIFNNAANTKPLYLNVHIPWPYLQCQIMDEIDEFAQKFATHTHSREIQKLTISRPRFTNLPHLASKYGVNPVALCKMWQHQYQRLNIHGSWYFHFRDNQSLNTVFHPKLQEIVFDVGCFWLGSKNCCISSENTWSPLTLGIRLSTEKRYYYQINNQINETFDTFTEIGLSPRIKTWRIVDDIDVIDGFELFSTTLSKCLVKHLQINVLELCLTNDCSKMKKLWQYIKYLVQNEEQWNQCKQVSEIMFRLQYSNNRHYEFMDVSHCKTSYFLDPRLTCFTYGFSSVNKVGIELHNAIIMYCQRQPYTQSTFDFLIRLSL